MFSSKAASYQHKYWFIIINIFFNKTQCFCRYMRRISGNRGCGVYASPVLMEFKIFSSPVAWSCISEATMVQIWSCNWGKKKPALLSVNKWFSNYIYPLKATTLLRVPLLTDNLFS